MQQITIRGIAPEPAASLKQLAGGWNREEADDFERAIQSCEQIDEEMWK